MNLHLGEAAVTLTGARHTSNHLLAVLPSVDYYRLVPALVDYDVRPRQILQRHGEPLERVFLPQRGICSLLQTMEDGASLEVAMIGEEGMIGIGAILGDGIASGTIVARTTGTMQTLALDAFRREMDQHGAFYDVMTRYCQRFIGLVSQSAACNGLHSARQRISRWLLASSDRLHSDELVFTHELLAMMLGVRRPTVTLLLEQLAKDAVIWQRRGTVRIVNRPDLVKAACECYEHERDFFN
jgi:CRP-like cAMP-binding protein